MCEMCERIADHEFAPELDAACKRADALLAAMTGHTAEEFEASDRTAYNVQDKGLYGSHASAMGVALEDVELHAYARASLVVEGLYREGLVVVTGIEALDKQVLHRVLGHLQAIVAQATTLGWLLRDEQIKAERAQA
jgi:hypothetical protein